MDYENWRGTAGDVRRCLTWLMQKWIDTRDHTNTIKNTALQPDVQDAVQQVLLSILKTLPSNDDTMIVNPKTGEPKFRSIDDLERYVKASIRRGKCRISQRKQSLGAHAGNEDKSLFTGFAAPPDDDHLLKTERLAAIEQCLEELSSRARSIVISHSENEANATVCLREGVKEDNRRAILSRALKQIRTCIANRFGTKEMGLI
jgi:hypothetical protein